MTLKMLTNRFLIFFQKFSEYFQTFLYFFHIFNRNFYRNFRPQICPVNHTQFYFCYWNHQRLLKTFIWYEKLFVFSWLCPEKSLLKPSEIAVFGLQMIYIGNKNRPLWTTPISKLEFSFNILLDSLINFHKLHIFKRKVVRFHLIMLAFGSWITFQSQK